ncbi:MAG TPA: glutamate racemase [Casimicrobiaceae bacterium]|nr:glutamate racemase [Casimicrobiaceae bacterium]
MIDPRTQPIGVFDSGVGGLAVVEEIRRLLPLESILYVADSGFAPYGERSIAYIDQRCAAIAEFLIGAGAKAIVVACNTATAAIAPRLRQRVAVPVVAIEPAVKPAASLSRSGVVGVLATQHTLASERFLHLVGAHASGVEVVAEICGDLVNLVERGVVVGEEAVSLVGPHVEALRARGADTLVLGCTHFHFLRSIVEAVAGPTVRVIDPGAAVAAELRRRLEAASLLSPGPRDERDRIWTSGDVAHGNRVIARLWQWPSELAPLPAAYCMPPAA